MIPDWWMDDDSTIPDTFSIGFDDLGCPCRERHLSGYLCTRPQGHGGRHLAGTGKYIHAAWPGTEAPEVSS